MPLFGTDGIRALAGEGPLSDDNVVLLGRAIQRLLKSRPEIFRNRGVKETRRTVTRDHSGAGKVLIGRDTRASGAAIENHLIEGFGLGAISVGVLPTPGIAYLVRKWNCSLGIVISASHNPADYNGIKVIAPDGFKIPDEAEAAIEQAVRTETAAAPSFIARLDFSSRKNEYAQFLRAHFGPDALKGLRLVVDAANGAASGIAPSLFRAAGADVVALNTAPDGRNINVHAGVLEPEMLADLVRREKANLGIAYDGDADRCILIDETGAVRDGDFILAVAAAHMKERGLFSSDTVVSTVMANYGLEKFLSERGLKLERTAVGDKWVAEAMMKSGASLGGEQSGHVIFFDALPTGDGMLTSIRILKIMLERKQPLSALCAGLVKVPQILKNVRVGSKPDLASVPALRDAIARGEKDLAGRGRLLVRYSGTEPLCRVMAEGSDDAVVRRVVDEVAAVAAKVLA
jgi:phosphoglucosamine mutase